MQRCKGRFGRDVYLHSKTVFNSLGSFLRYFVIKLCLSSIAFVLFLCPHTWRMWLGKRLGHILAKTLPRRVRIAKTNLALCFSHRSDITRQAMLDEHIDAIGMGMIEGVMAWYFPLSRLRGMLDIEGQELLDRALETAISQERPILLFGLHTTSIDLTPPFLRTVMMASGVYKPLRNKALDQLVLKGRLRHAEHMLSQNDMRGMLAHLQRGKHLWYASDQDFGLVAKGEFADFFEQSAHTLTLFAKMAQRTNAIVLPVGVFRQSNKQAPYLMRFLPALSSSDYATAVQAAQLANQTVEQLCDGFEPQYYWVHRRFKTQPDGQTIYDASEC